MFTLVETNVFTKWFSKVESRARTRVQARLDRLVLGNSGDAKPVGKGVMELRIDFGPGYRVYYCRRGSELLILLAGGDKRTQKADIAEAIALKQTVEDMPWPK
jgi:putative addiction module killer protein